MYLLQVYPKIPFGWLSRKLHSSESSKETGFICKMQMLIPNNTTVLTLTHMHYLGKIIAISIFNWKIIHLLLQVQIHLRIFLAKPKDILHMHILQKKKKFYLLLFNWNKIPHLILVKYLTLLWDKTRKYFNAKSVPGALFYAIPS